MLDETTLGERQRSTVVSVRAYTGQQILTHSTNRLVNRQYRAERYGICKSGTWHGCSVGGTVPRDRTYVRVFELHLAEEQWGLHAGKREGNVPSRQSTEPQRAQARRVRRTR